MTPWTNGRRYSSDLRELVVQAAEAGQTLQMVARTYRMTLKTVRSYVAKKGDGTLHAVKNPAGRPRIVQAHHELQLLKQAKEKPDATLEEHRVLLEEETGLKISFKTVDRVFRRHRITHKKKSLIASERNEESRVRFLNEITPLLSKMEDVVFLDESGFNISMTRKYARAQGTLRALGTVPRNHGINHTLICGIQLSGPVGELIIDGSVNGMVFEHYIREILCPKLTKGQTVVMDNLSAHHRDSIRDLIEAKGCNLVYLPSYSPDFNPIEMMFSKVKALVRGWGKRTVRELIEAVWDALNVVSRSDILGWFRCAYPGMVL